VHVIQADHGLRPAENNTKWREISDQITHTWRPRLLAPRLLRTDLV
jgi:hypothetical protein